MIIALIIVALALALLVTRDLCRWLGRRLEKRLGRGPVQFEGTAFNARSVSPRLDTVRQDYLAEIHAREHPDEYRDDLLASVREAIRRLAFFARRAEGDPDLTGK
jgi:hypothetical protein